MILYNYKRNIYKKNIKSQKIKTIKELDNWKNLD